MRTPFGCPSRRVACQNIAPSRRAPVAPSPTTTDADARPGQPNKQPKQMEPVHPGVHVFGAAPRVTAERQSSDDVQIPRERPTPRRLDFGESEPKRPRTESDRVRVGYIVRHPRPPTGDLCQRLRMRVTVDGNERGTIAGTIVYLRRLRQGANFHGAASNYSVGSVARDADGGTASLRSAGSLARDVGAERALGLYLKAVQG